MLEFSNGVITINVEKRGAQLRSLVKDGHDFIWDGSEFWNYSSPMLFPIVGKLKNNRYRFNGKTYELPQHGFARIADFKFERGIFILESNADTLKVYPWEFRVEVSFTLIRNRLVVANRVYNLDNKVMYFSLGAHPALRVDGDFDSWRIEFARKQKLQRLPLTAEGLLSRERVDFLDSRTVKLSYEMFKEDALIFDELRGDSVTLGGKTNS